MKTASKIERLSDIELTISGTTSVREWERLAASLNDRAGPQKQFREAIERALVAVKKIDEPAGLVIGELRSAVAE